MNPTMPTIAAFAAMALLALPSACDSATEADPTTLLISVESLHLTTSLHACYMLQVHSGDPGPVTMSEGRVASSLQFESVERCETEAGGGVDISAICDVIGDEANGTTLLHLTGLLDGDGETLDLSDYDSPCSEESPCAQRFECVKRPGEPGGAGVYDVEVKYNLAIFKAAHQGFFDIEVNDMGIDGLHKVCYALAVVSDEGVGVSPIADLTEFVWKRTDLCTEEYGNRLDMLAYIGPCDADKAVNRVFLSLDSALDSTESPFDVTSAANPCPPSQPCVKSAPCMENVDRTVTFDFGE